MSWRANRGGFSLIEVSLAVLVVGLGLLSIFGLFPAGLKMSEDSIADTRAAMFAEYVFSDMREKAAAAQWNEWNAAALKPDFISVLDAIQPIRFTPGQSPTAPSQPHDPDCLRYRLHIENDGPKTATLEVWDGQFGPTNTVQGVFYTAFYFTGM